MFNDLSSRPPVASDSIFTTLALLALKCIRRCIVFGHRRIHEQPAIVTFLAASAESIRQLVHAYFGQSPTSIANVQGKLLLQYGKLFADLQEFHTVECVLVPGVMAMAQTNLDLLQSLGGRSRLNDLQTSYEQSGSTPLHQRIVIQSLSSIRTMLKNPAMGMPLQPSI